MVKPVSSTLSPSNRNGAINQLDYAIQSRIYDLNTMLPCEILTIYSGDNGNNLYDVKSLLNPRDAKGRPAVDENGTPISPPTIPRVTASIIAGGISAIIIPYAVGDKVWVSFCQRDITNAIGAKFQTTTPASARALSLCDGVIKCHIDNKEPDSYTTFIKFMPDGTLSITVTDGKPMNFKASTFNFDGDVNITGSTTMQDGVDVTGGLTTDTASIGGINFATHVHLVTAVDANTGIPI